MPGPKAAPPEPPISASAGSLQPISVEITHSDQIHRGKSNYRALAAALGAAPDAGTAPFPPSPPPFRSLLAGTEAPHLRHGSGEHQAPVGHPGAARAQQPINAEAEEGEDVEQIEQHLVERGDTEGHHVPHGTGGSPWDPPLSPLGHPHLHFGVGNGVAQVGLVLVDVLEAGISRTVQNHLRGKGGDAGDRRVDAPTPSSPRYPWDPPCRHPALTMPLKKVKAATRSKSRTSTTSWGRWWSHLRCSSATWGGGEKTPQVGLCSPKSLPPRSRPLFGSPAPP